MTWVDNYDAAVLVSSDKDFVPVAEFLETRGASRSFTGRSRRGEQS